VYEELRIVPSQLSQEKRSTGFVEPKVLVLSPNPGLQLLIDVINQREQRGTAETAVITDPPPEERIDLLGDLSQRPRRLPRMCKLRIVARMDFTAVGLTAGAYEYGGSETTNGNAALGSNTATSRVYGQVIGADYRISPFTLAGLALAGGGTNFSVANNFLGTGRSDLFQAGAFIRHTVGAAYVTGAFAYGWQDVTTNRTVSIAGIDTLQAKFNTNALSGRLEGGYSFVTPWMGITPYAAGKFTTYDLPAYAEQALSGANTFALNYASRIVTASRSELGVRTDSSYALSTAILTLRSRFAWARNFNNDPSIAATFQTLPGASFVVNGAFGVLNVCRELRHRWTPPTGLLI
jgi:uncharacterized protein YhjY with autotransporter beta-barrel domain